MCAQYTVEPGPSDLIRIFDALFPESEEFLGEVRVLPHQTAPVLTAESKNRLWQMMKFSLLPAWSKEPKVKFATHNARLSSVDEKTGKTVFVFEKPTWRSPFQSRPCLIPINSFFEAAYRGPLAGNMVKFTPEDHSLLMAAGIWESWTSKETGEVILSFAILTDEPSKEIKKYGHDRSPVFLDEKAWNPWLNANPKQNSKEKVEFLLSHKADVIFAAEADRPLKAGWEKRIPKD